MKITGYSRESERNLLTAEQMRELDRGATDNYGIPSLLLMENAGKAVADAARARFPRGELRPIIVVAGPGNNGGDGLVTARHLHESPLPVQVFYWGDRDSAKGDALANIEMAEKIGMPIDFSRDVDRLERALQGCHLVIDALLGTGAKGHLRADYADAVRAVNMSGISILSVDIPSGIDADTGAELGPTESPCGRAAVKADVTVTFAAMKIGLVTYPGAWCTGEIVVADIGIPEAAYEEIKPAATLVCCDDVGCPYAFYRPPDSHKGLYGHVAIVAGSVGLTGAATLAAMGALRIGTGLVTVAVPESLNDIMEVKLTEAMTIPVPEGKARAFGIASLDKVLEIINERDAAVIGPGFGRNEDTIAFTLKLIRKLKKPSIIDADALYAVSRDLSVLKKCKAQLVITPHPGEMATLLGTTTDEVQSNRLEVARAFAKEHGVTVVLKGAGTVIAEPDGSAFINTTGSPGMATGGTGDVLSGMIGGLLAQENDSDAAAKAAVYLHGRAGEIAAERLGEVSMIASDVADSISAAIQEVTKE